MTISPISQHISYQAIISQLDSLIEETWMRYWSPRFSHDLTSVLSFCGNDRFAAELALALENVYQSQKVSCDLEAIRRWQTNLVVHSRQRFRELGGFAWTGHHGFESNRVIDTNEVASVVEYLCRLQQLAGDLPEEITKIVSELVPECCNVLLGVIPAERVGIFLKSRGHKAEILNTTASAAAALLTAAHAGYFDRNIADDLARASCQHLIERFGKNAKGWWSYSESLEGNGVILGVSVNYQAVTLLGFARLLEGRGDPAALSVMEQAATALHNAVTPDGSFDWSAYEERLDHRGYPQICAAVALVSTSRLSGNLCYLSTVEKTLAHIRHHQFREGKFIFEPAPKSTGAAQFRDSTVQISLFYLSTALRQSLEDETFPIPYPG